jgi:hypothetical protein
VMGATKGRIMHVGRVKQICTVNAPWGQKYVAIYSAVLAHGAFHFIEWSDAIEDGCGKEYDTFLRSDGERIGFDDGCFLNSLASGVPERDLRDGQGLDRLR